MPFWIEVTCPDCTGEDFMGCGEGFPWRWERGEKDEFATREEAQAEADRLETEGYGGIWEFEVKESEPRAAPLDPAAALSSPVDVGLRSWLDAAQGGEHLECAESAAILVEQARVEAAAAERDAIRLIVADEDEGPHGQDYQLGDVEDFRKRCLAQIRARCPAPAQQQQETHEKD